MEKFHKHEKTSQAWKISTSMERFCDHGNVPEK